MQQAGSLVVAPRLLSCGMQTLSCNMHVGSSSLTRARTRASCIASAESYPLRHQGSPCSMDYYFWVQFEVSFKVYSSWWFGVCFCHAPVSSYSEPLETKFLVWVLLDLTGSMGSGPKLEWEEGDFFFSLLLRLRPADMSTCLWWACPVPVTTPVHPPTVLPFRFPTFFRPQAFVLLPLSSPLRLSF